MGSAGSLRLMDRWPTINIENRLRTAVNGGRSCGVSDFGLRGFEDRSGIAGSGESEWTLGGRMESGGARCAAPLGQFASGSCGWSGGVDFDFRNTRASIA